MHITPLASESMGARSMATYVETRDSKIIIDPWVSETGLRFGLPPHKVEVWHAEKLKSRIRLFLNSANVIVITHFDDATFSLLTSDVCGDKTIFMKNPNQHTCTDHRNNAFRFIEKVRSLTSVITFADGKSLKWESTKLVFPESCESGCEDTVGWVLPLMISDLKDVFLYSSGIAGVFAGSTATLIKKQRPNIIYLDGPVTIWREGKYAQKELDAMLKCLMEVMDSAELDLLIVDHHLLRDFGWLEKIKLLFKWAEARNITIKTAAVFRGDEDNLLEAHRQSLYESDPA